MVRTVPVKTMKFPRERMLAVLWEDEGVILSDKVTDNSRWSIHHELIFQLDGKTYQTTYSVGATESQDERPWDYDDEVTCTEVRPVRKEVVVWEPVAA